MMAEPFLVDRADRGEAPAQQSPLRLSRAETTWDTQAEFTFIPSSLVPFRSVSDHESPLLGDRLSLKGALAIAYWVG